MEEQLAMEKGIIRSERHIVLNFIAGLAEAMILMMPIIT
jgi:hypothetical protein